MVTPGAVGIAGIVNVFAPGNVVHAGEDLLSWKTMLPGTTIGAGAGTKGGKGRGGRFLVT